MKFYILFFISLVLCYCDGTSRRSGGGNKQTNSGKETDPNTAFWAARGKRNDMSGILKCSFVKTHEDISDSDSDFSWARPNEQNELPIRSDINTEAWDARFKRSAEASRPFYVPAWVMRALASSSTSSNSGNSRGNNEVLSSFLRLVEKKNEKDGASGTATNDASVPFWAARG